MADRSIGRGTLGRLEREELARTDRNDAVQPVETGDDLVAEGRDRRTG